MPTQKKVSEVSGKSSYSLVKRRKRENKTKQKYVQQPNPSVGQHFASQEERQIDQFR